MFTTNVRVKTANRTQIFDIEAATQDDMEATIKKLLDNRINGHSAKIRHSVTLLTEVNLEAYEQIYEASTIQLFYNNQWGMWEIFFTDFPNHPERFMSIDAAISQFARYIALSE